MPAKGTAEWKGDLPTGAGTFTAGDTISGGYTFKSRFEDGPGSNPEQLIAAAHAACFSMALSNILAQAGSTADAGRRRQYYAQAAKIIWDDAVGMFPMTSKIVYVSNKKLTGFTLSPQGYPDFSKASAGS